MARKHHTWRVKDIYSMCVEMQNNKFDCIICLDGSRGLGKSSLGFKIAKNFQQFNPYDDIVFAREDVNRLLTTKKFSVILADEMINVAYKRDFYQDEQKSLVKYLNMYRDSCNILIMCVPNFYHLDIDLRDLIKIRITIVKRGVGVLQTPIKKLYSIDRWDTRINQKIESEWIEKRNIKPRYTRLSTFRGFVRFHDLKKKNREIYEKIKQEKRFLATAEKDFTPDFENFYEHLIEIAVKDGMTTDTFMTMCKIKNVNHKTALTSIRKYLIKKHDPLKFQDLLLDNDKKLVEIQRQKVEGAIKVRKPNVEADIFGFED